ncbi:2-oxoglutarate (2OG) and Fe(II)-dependent oxygenase superfamily protein [Striga asiatica]|uniref:2-oxoglutarate (2OG) and Fe(II)-dependent oxygenase superfamily protein n=1 Tax=Striga asiatica TaxID=4170 RepID=A0A5A7Q2Z0_STRAF|nr:2-oxoglutarate (2OG) and Fe(II)-dependent oxygenase superfamily protein [Striga asiatica]
MGSFRLNISSPPLHSGPLFLRRLDSLFRFKFYMPDSNHDFFTYQMNLDFITESTYKRINEGFLTLVLILKISALAVVISMEVAGTEIRVQSLIEDGKKPVVPPQYVQPVEARPRHTPEANKNCIEAPPIIDLCSLDSVGELGNACKQWGAFHVVNHGIPAKLLDEMRRLGCSFFEDCTMDQKLRFACNPNSPASEGYGSRMLVESNDTVLDWRDYFDHHSLPLSRRDPSKWPSFSSNYREVVAEYSDQMSVLADKLLRMISESLGLPSSCIKEVVGEFYQNITVSYYPPCPQPELTLGLQSHSDFGAITLLIQDDVGGLQVSKDGEWITVNPLSDAIFVILADQTEVFPFSFSL